MRLLYCPALPTGFCAAGKTESDGGNRISDSLASGVNQIGTWVFFVVIGIFAIWVLGKFFGSIKFLRGDV